MSTSTLHRFSHGHQDLLLSLDYNLYGTRLATSSSDHKVKVWNLSPSTNQWTVIDVWTAHSAEVTSLKWAPPFSGEHIATISEDALLKLWSEDASAPHNSSRRFRLIFQHSTSNGVPYASLDFKSLGVETYLAVTTRDGHLTIWEPEDHDDLSAWKVIWGEWLGKMPARTEETGFRVCWHGESVPAWQAVVAGVDRRALSLVVGVGKTARVMRSDRERGFYTAATLEGAGDLVRDVSWANGSMRGWDVIATASRDGCIRVYEVHTPGAAGMSTVGEEGAGERERDREREKEGGGRVAAVRSGIGAGLAAGAAAAAAARGGTAAAGVVRQEARLVAEMEAHSMAPWRVTWSPLGDVLVSTGDDGMTRLWQRLADGKWAEAAEIDVASKG